MWNWNSSPPPVIPPSQNHTFYFVVSEPLTPNQAAQFEDATHYVVPSPVSDETGLEDRVYNRLAADISS